MAVVSVSQLKRSFSDTCQTTVKCQFVCPALVVGPPNRRSYNKYFLFFHQFIARALHVWAINRREKTRSVIYGTDRKAGKKS